MSKSISSYRMDDVVVDGPDTSLDPGRLVVSLLGDRKTLAEAEQRTEHLHSGTSLEAPIERKV